MCRVKHKSEGFTKIRVLGGGAKHAPNPYNTHLPLTTLHGIKFIVFIIFKIVVILVRYLGRKVKNINMQFLKCNAHLYGHYTSQKACQTIKLCKVSTTTSKNLLSRYYDMKIN
jgi:hypothetical protein